MKTTRILPAAATLFAAALVVFGAAQVSTVPSRGPIIQDRVLFLENALLQVDHRVSLLENAFRKQQQEDDSLKKDLQTVKERLAKLEKKPAEAKPGGGIGGG